MTNEELMVLVEGRDEEALLEVINTLFDMMDDDQQVLAYEAVNDLLNGDESFDESMDGDHESALASAGFGTDEDYGYFGGDE